MKASITQDGLTVRAIAGTHNIILAIDLQENKRANCLGFSIQRADLGPKGIPLPVDQQKTRWLPNSLRFPKDTNADDITTDRAPLQKFRWGDYTADPGHTYRYRVIAQYGQWNQMTQGAAVEVEITTEDPTNPETAVFFNRGAAASQAYNHKFGDADPGKLPADKQTEVFAWLSRGLEEALLSFLEQARDSTFALHAAIYEFQKPNLLQALKAAIARGAEVKVVYHHRNAGPKDDTWKKNDDAVAANGLTDVAVPRKANPQGAISHNKFVVLLKNGEPQAVWTGSTNWTEGAIYGQLNVGHAVYDPGVATTYDKYFQLLHADTAFAPLKAALRDLTVVPATLPTGPGIWPVLSPQPDDKMLKLYAALASNAKCLLVCAPFELAPAIRAAYQHPPKGTLHLLLVDKEGSLGSKQEVQVTEGDPANMVSAATTLSSPLHDFQGKLLEGKESYHHAGIHIHSKIIAADPFGSDPIIVTGSANFSSNSTINNDSNSLVVRGHTAVADIYATEFMRMFEHYLFRGTVAKADAAATAAGKKPEDAPLCLVEDDSWSATYYVPDSIPALVRQVFAGTTT